MTCWDTNKDNPSFCGRKLSQHQKIVVFLEEKKSASQDRGCTKSWMYIRKLKKKNSLLETKWISFKTSAASARRHSAYFVSSFLHPSHILPDLLHGSSRQMFGKFLQLNFEVRLGLFL
jgi:hypothetical protein